MSSAVESFPEIPQKGVRPDHPTHIPCSWVNVSLTVLALLAIICGSLSVAEVGIFKAVGSYGWCGIGGGVILQIISCAITYCRKPPTGLGLLSQKIESAACSSLKSYVSGDVRHHYYTRVFLFLKPKNSNLVDQRDFMITGDQNFREVLSRHLESLEGFSFENYDLEFVTVTKMHAKGFVPSYTIDHEYFQQSSFPKGYVINANDRAELVEQLSPGLFHVALNLLPNFQFPIESIS